MQKNKWELLQMFAGEGAAGGTGGSGDGGAGAQAADAGVTDVDAGHQRLLELGVPADKLRKRAKKQEVQLPEGAVRTAQPTQQKEADKPQEQAAAAEPTEGNTQESKRMTWDEIMADPEYNQEMQKTMQARLKTAKAAEENMGHLSGALAMLAERYGLDPVKPDYEALAKKIQEDDSFFESKASEMGTSPDIARKLTAYDAMQAQQEEQKQQTLQQQAMQQHFEKLEQQAQKMKEVFPKFELRAEMQNPTFVRMTSPSVGLSVEDAYYAIHRNEIQTAAMQAAAQQTAEKISKSIQSGSRRPEENGTSGNAPSVSTFDYRNASKEQRDALKQAIRRAGAEGRKLYPGGQ